MSIDEMKHLKQRLLFGSLGGILTLFVIYFSHTPILEFIFPIITTAIFSGALWEYYNIAKEKGLTPLTTVGLSASVAYLLATFFHARTSQAEMLPTMILSVTLLLAFVYYFIKGKDPYNNLAVTFFGIVYLTLPLSCLIRINYFENGRLWLFYLLAVTKTTDTGAYFVGKIVSQKKLAPYISPKKTWAGAIGGFFAALGMSIAFYAISNYFDPSLINLSLSQSIWLGCTIGILAQIGDLAESLLKRDAGVKDSNQLPGLGGMFDIVDSVIFTAPFLYFFLKLR